MATSQEFIPDGRAVLQQYWREAWHRRANGQMQLRRGRPRKYARVAATEPQSVPDDPGEARRLRWREWKRDSRAKLPLPVAVAPEAPQVGREYVQRPAWLTAPDKSGRWYRTADGWLGFEASAKE